LKALAPELAIGFEQVVLDLDGPERLTYLGPAGEAREVLRASEQMLAPDEAVMAQKWFAGHDGRPTQSERVRHAVQSKVAKLRHETVEADELVDAILAN